MSDRDQRFANKANRLSESVRGAHDDAASAPAFVRIVTY